MYSHNVDFLGSRRMETAPTSIEVLLRLTLGQSDEPSDLRGSLSPTSVYSTWQSQAVTHPLMNRARRCLTSVIEPITMSERRIPYKNDLHTAHLSRVDNEIDSALIYFLQQPSISSFYSIFYSVQDVLRLVMNCMQPFTN